MNDDPTGRFGGYWITPPLEWLDSEDNQRPITVVIFVEEGFYYLSDLQRKPGGEDDDYEILLSVFSYWIHEDRIGVTRPRNTDSLDDKDWKYYQWRLGRENDRPLQFRLEGQSEWTSFYPATKDLIESAGFPRAYIESVENAIREAGFHIKSESTVPLVKSMFRKRDE